MRVSVAEHPRKDYVLLKLTPVVGLLPEVRPGQFVEVRIPKSPHAMLRRPISVNYVDYENNRLWILVHAVGEGTRTLEQCGEGEILNCLFPLGNGFSMPECGGERILLVGGGVGAAPLLYYGKMLGNAGCVPTFLLGGRSSCDLMQLDLFEKLGVVCITTEDGTMGERGFVTDHGILKNARFDRVATCGPKPMMIAVAKWAARTGIVCEASLENMMACGLGACLCCVEKMKDGHNLCVCKDGPVFNTNYLSWLN